MQTAPWLLAALLLALPLRATIAPDLAELARQIERFPQSAAGTDGERLAKFFDLYWAASMREAPDFASYVGYAGLEDRLPDLSPEAIAHSRRLLHLELAALTSIDRSRLTPAEQLSYDLLRRSFELGIESERFPGPYLLVTRMNNRLTQALGLLYYMPARTVADYEKMLARLRGFPRLVEQGIALLEEGSKRGITPPRVTLDGVAAQVLAPLADDPLESPTLEPFQHIPETVPAAERERLRGAAADLFRQQVAPALRRLHDYLADSYVPRARESISASGLPDGQAYYAHLLRASTTTDLTPEQIHQLGLSEVARIRKEMDAVVAATGFQGPFQEFLEYLRTDSRFFYDAGTSTRSSRKGGGSTPRASAASSGSTGTSTQGSDSSTTRCGGRSDWWWTPACMPRDGPASRRSTTAAPTPRRPTARSPTRSTATSRTREG